MLSYIMLTVISMEYKSAAVSGTFYEDYGIHWIDPIIFSHP